MSSPLLLTAAVTSVLLLTASGELAASPAGGSAAGPSLAGPPPADEPRPARAPGPKQLKCIQKPFINLEGQNALTLTRQPNGSYTATYETYGPIKTKKHLACVFDAEPGIFACLAAHAAWGIYGKKVDERVIDGEGRITESHAYDIEAVRAPEGEPTKDTEIRFERDACKSET